MATRLITMTHTRATYPDEPWEGARGSVSLASVGAANQTTNLNQWRQDYVTDAAGEGYRVRPDGTLGDKGVEVVVADEEDIPFYYRFEEPDGVVTTLAVMPGAATTLEALKKAQSILEPVQPSAYVPKDLTQLPEHEADVDDDDLLYLNLKTGEYRAVKASKIGTGEGGAPDPEFPEDYYIADPKNRAEMIGYTEPISEGGTVDFREGTGIVQGTGVDFTSLSPFDILYDHEDTEHWVLRVISPTSLQLIHKARVRSVATFKYRKTTGLVSINQKTFEEGFEEDRDANFGVITPFGTYHGLKRSQDSAGSLPALWTEDYIARGWFQVISRPKSRVGGFIGNINIWAEKLDGEIGEPDTTAIDEYGLTIGLFGTDGEERINDNGYAYISLQHFDPNPDGADGPPISKEDAVALSRDNRRIAIFDNSGEIELRDLTKTRNDSEVDRLYNEGGFVRISNANPVQAQAPRAILVGTVTFAWNDGSPTTTFQAMWIAPEIVGVIVNATQGNINISFQDYPVYSNTHFVTLAQGPIHQNPGGYAQERVSIRDDQADPNGIVMIRFDMTRDDYDYMVQVWETHRDPLPTVTLTVPDGEAGSLANWVVEAFNLPSVMSDFEFHWWESLDGGAENYLGKTDSPDYTYMMPDGAKQVKGRVEVHPATGGSSADEPTEEPLAEAEDTGIIHPQPATITSVTTDHISKVTAAFDAPLMGVVETYDAFLLTTDLQVADSLTDLPPSTTNVELTGQHGSSYWVEIHAKHADDGLSIVRSDATILVAQDAITDLRADFASHNQVVLVWTNPVGQGTILRTRIYRDDVGLLFEQDPADDSFDDNLVLPETTYTYTVTTVNEGGESLPSNELEITTPEDPGTGPPSYVIPGPNDLVAVGDQTDIELTWTLPNDESEMQVLNCQIWRDGDLIDNVPPADLVGGVQTYQDPDLAFGQVYSYQVSYFNAAGQGPLGNTALGTTTGVPRTPSLGLSSVGDGVVNLVIIPEGNGDEVGYEIEHAENPGFTNSTTVDVGTDLTPTITGLTNGIVNYFKARSYNVADERSGDSNVIEATPAASGVPDRENLELYFQHQHETYRDQDGTTPAEIGEFTRSWRDQAGGYLAFASFDTNSPTKQEEGLHFDGNDAHNHWEIPVELLNENEKTVYFRVNPEQAVGNCHFLRRGNDYFGINFEGPGGTYRVCYQGQYFNTDLPVVLDDEQVIACRWRTNGSDWDFDTWLHDGATITRGTTITRAKVANAAAVTWVMGGRTSSADGMIGLIFDGMLYDTAQATATVEEVLNFLIAGGGDPGPTPPDYDTAVVGHWPGDELSGNLIDRSGNQDAVEHGEPNPGDGTWRNVPGDTAGFRLADPDWNWPNSFTIMGYINLDAGSDGVDVFPVGYGRGRTTNEDGSHFRIANRGDNQNLRIEYRNESLGGTNTPQVPAPSGNIYGVDTYFSAKYDAPSKTMHLALGQVGFPISRASHLGGVTAEELSLKELHLGSTNNFALVGGMRDYLLLDIACVDEDEDWYWNDGAGRTNAEIEARRWTPIGEEIPPPNYDRSVVAHWPLDELSGPAVDRSQQVPDAVEVNPPIAGDGTIRTFVAANAQHFETPQDIGAFVGGSYTLMGFFVQDAATDFYFFVYGNNANAAAGNIFSGQGRTNFGIRFRHTNAADTVVTLDTNIGGALGVKQFGVLRYDAASDTATYRMNDAAWRETTDIGGVKLPVGSTDRILMGSRSHGAGANHGDGSVGQFLVLDIAASDADVDWYWNDGLGRTNEEIENRRWTAITPTPRTWSELIAENVIAEGPIGGGVGYKKIIREADADVVVNTWAELETELAARADSGDIIFIPRTATISVPATTRNTSVSGVTVASDRGHMISDGLYSRGALILTTLNHADSNIDAVFRVRNSARMTGFRLQGPSPHGGGTYEDAQKGIGIQTFTDQVEGQPCEIDNCEIYGWHYMAIETRNSWEHRVHHNWIHDTNFEGYGYGIWLCSTSESAGHDLWMYGNVFQRNRHARDHNSELVRYHETGNLFLIGSRYQVHSVHTQGSGGVPNQGRAALEYNMNRIVVFEGYQNLGNRAFNLAYPKIETVYGDGHATFEHIYIAGEKDQWSNGGPMRFGSRFDIALDDAGQVPDPDDPAKQTVTSSSLFYGMSGMRLPVAVADVVEDDVFEGGEIVVGNGGSSDPDGHEIVEFLTAFSTDAIWRHEQLRRTPPSGRWTVKCMARNDMGIIGLPVEVPVVVRPIAEGEYVLTGVMHAAEYLQGDWYALQVRVDGNLLHSRVINEANVIAGLRDWEPFEIPFNGTPGQTVEIALELACVETHDGTGVEQLYAHFDAIAGFGFEVDNGGFENGLVEWGDVQNGTGWGRQYASVPTPDGRWCSRLSAGRIGSGQGEPRSAGEYKRLTQNVTLGPHQANVASAVFEQGTGVTITLEGAASGAVHYDIYRSTKEKEDYTLVLSGQTGTTFVDGAGTVGAWYVVVSVDDADREARWSAPFQATGEAPEPGTGIIEHVAEYWEPDPGDLGKAIHNGQHLTVHGSGTTTSRVEAEHRQDVWTFDGNGRLTLDSPTEQPFTQIAGDFAVAFAWRAAPPTTGYHFIFSNGGFSASNPGLSITSRDNGNIDFWLADGTTRRNKGFQGAPTRFNPFGEWNFAVVNVDVVTPNTWNVWADGYQNRSDRMTTGVHGASLPITPARPFTVASRYHNSQNSAFVGDVMPPIFIQRHVTDEEAQALTGYMRGIAYGRLSNLADVITARDPIWSHHTLSTASRVAIAGVSSGTSVVAICFSKVTGLEVGRQTMPVGANGVFNGEILGLAEGVDYWIEYQVDGRDSCYQNNFTAAPAPGAKGEAGSFKAVIAGCQDDAQESYTQVGGLHALSQGAKYVLFNGDWHYNDPVYAGDVQVFHDAHTDSLNVREDSNAWFRHVRRYWSYIGDLIYIQDNHDRVWGQTPGAEHNPDKNTPGMVESGQERRRSFPYPISQFPWPSPTAGSNNFFAIVGRVMLCAFEGRNEKVRGSSGGATMCDQQQLDWIKAQMDFADLNGYAFVFFQNFLWHNEDNSQPTDDGWDSSATAIAQRQELIDYADGLGIDMLVIGGDIHGMHLDSGLVNGNYGQAIRMSNAMPGRLGHDQGGTKGGPWDFTENRTGGQWLIMDVDDDGNAVSITVSGYSGSGASLVHSFTHSFLPGALENGDPVTDNVRMFYRLNDENLTLLSRYEVWALWRERTGIADVYEAEQLVRALLSQISRVTGMPPEVLAFDEIRMLEQLADMLDALADCLGEIPPDGPPPGIV